MRYLVHNLKVGFIPQIRLRDWKSERGLSETLSSERCERAPTGHPGSLLRHEFGVLRGVLE
jgi:hypothetical protein